ncbi:hypothetical protein [Sanxia atyid shrimp virus 1]|uniref:hypothetical protein n=1 Tax=Sanxia atyid shrimp virus 1 TaxID=1923355 RepID=UPI00090A9065|nr:hypothetical protein [Sanxia atyid shrimp virus 1]APG77738.1 hypothetical protein [Sanxia atyid shrimp virus 1]
MNFLTASKTTLALIWLRIAPMAIFWIVSSVVRLSVTTVCPNQLLNRLNTLNSLFPVAISVVLHVLRFFLTLLSHVNILILMLVIRGLEFSSLIFSLITSCPLSLLLYYLLLFLLAVSPAFLLAAAVANKLFSPSSATTCVFMALLPLVTSDALFLSSSSVHFNDITQGSISPSPSVPSGQWFLTSPLTMLNPECSYILSTSRIWPSECELPLSCGDMLEKQSLGGAFFSETDLCFRFFHDYHTFQSYIVYGILEGTLNTSSYQIDFHSFDPPIWLHSPSARRSGWIHLDAAHYFLHYDPLKNKYAWDSSLFNTKRECHMVNTSAVFFEAPYIDYNTSSLLLHDLIFQDYLSSGIPLNYTLHPKKTYAFGTELVLSFVPNSYFSFSVLGNGFISSDSFTHLLDNGTYITIESDPETLSISLYPLDFNPFVEIFEYKGHSFSFMCTSTCAVEFLHYTNILSWLNLTSTSIKNTKERCVRSISKVSYTNFVTGIVYRSISTFEHAVIRLFRLFVDAISTAFQQLLTYVLSMERQFKIIEFGIILALCTAHFNNISTALLLTLSIWYVAPFNTQ